MFKKIILSVFILALLVSVGLVFAQEEEEVGEGRQLRRGQARRLEQDRFAGRPGKKGVGPMVREQGALVAGLDRWLEELTEAYRLKDDERMGQLLRRMNQARQKVQDRGGRFGQGLGQGMMRGSRLGRVGPRAGRMERFVPPMRGRGIGPAARPRRGGGQGMGRRQGRGIGGAGGGLNRGVRGQGLGQRGRRMLRLREHAEDRFGDMGRRQGGRGIGRGSMAPKGPNW